MADYREAMTTQPVIAGRSSVDPFDVCLATLNRWKQSAIKSHRTADEGFEQGYYEGEKAAYHDAIDAVRRLRDAVKGTQ